MVASRSVKSGTSGPTARHADPSLLLKLLFTSQPLSIQVHPDDAFAHSMGLPNGKTEAWYVLSATPEAKVALGLTRRLTPQQLRTAIGDGSIADLMMWRSVSARDVISVPAGTIHAIGAGLVIAEIQQRSDTTFRLSDSGRGRELHIENAIAVAHAGPARFSAAAETVDQRTDNSRFRPIFRIRTDQPASSLIVVTRSGTRNLAAGPQRKRHCRIVRNCHRRGCVRANGHGRDKGRRYRNGRPRCLHGRQPSCEFTATLHGAGNYQGQDAKSEAACRRRLLKQRLSGRTGAWKRLNETPPACSLHRQLSATPLRHRYVYS